MRICILAIGSRGDIQPYLALGVGLKRAGHRVRMISPLHFKEFIEAHGVEFYPLSWDPRTFMSGPVTESGRSLFGFWRNFFPQERQVSAELFCQCEAACQDADVLLANVVAFFGPMLGEMLGIPTLLLSAVPGFRTRDLPQFFFPQLPRWMPLRGTYNRLSYDLFKTVALGFIVKHIGELRKRLPVLPRRSTFIKDSIRLERTIPILHEFSPSVIPEPSDWGEIFRVSGYWFLDRPSTWQPPKPVVDFLASGKTPIFISLGSVMGNNSESFANLVLEAVTLAGQRAILAGGWSDFGNFRSSENVLLLQEIPHDWIFPQVAAIVHHGGAGTTAAALRAGVPSIAVPHFGDQFFWGERIFMLGVGPKPIPRKRLAAGNLSVAIKQAVSDPVMRRKSAKLGEQIRSEDGVSRAVQWFEAWMQSNRREPSNSCSGQ